jgi:hypothetical protein
MKTIWMLMILGLFGSLALPAPVAAQTFNARNVQVRTNDHAVIYPPAGQPISGLNVSGLSGTVGSLAGGTFTTPTLVSPTLSGSVMWPDTTIQSGYNTNQFSGGGALSIKTRAVHGENRIPFVPALVKTGAWWTTPLTYTNAITYADALVSRGAVKTAMGTNSQGLMLYRYTIGNADAKRTILLTSLVHGGERAGYRMMLSYFYALTDPASQDVSVRWLRDNIRFVWVPVCNPHGANYNVRTNENGVDINRNFPVSLWDTHADEPGDTWKGPSAGSELETQLLVNLMDNLATDGLVSVIDLHDFWDIAGVGTIIHMRDGRFSWEEMIDIRRHYNGNNWTEQQVAGHSESLPYLTAYAVLNLDVWSVTHEFYLYDQAEYNVMSGLIWHSLVRDSTTDRIYNPSTRLSGPASALDRLELSTLSFLTGDYVGLRFGVSPIRELRKGGIAFERVASSGQGKLHFLLNNDANTNSVTLADSKMNLSRTGDLTVTSNIVSGGNISAAAATSASRLDLRTDSGSIGDWVGMRFAVSTSATTHQKAGILYERTADGARGKVHVAINNVNDGTAVSLSDAKLTVDRTGDVTVIGSIKIGGSTGPTWTAGSGSPEGAVTAPVGSFYSRTAGGAGTTLYVKESGTGNTGWAAK